jgi:UDP-N-acetylmuramoylalanine--D-glutamate ligase
MKPNPKVFEFSSYKLDLKKSSVFLRYKIEFSNSPDLEFEEEIVFPKPFQIKNIPAELLENILSSLHLMLGISYYKIYCPKKIRLTRSISKEQAEFWNTVYMKGLGEFSYRNNLDLGKIINFPYDKKIKVSFYDITRKDRALVGIGGGKDSIVAVELLRAQGIDITAFSVETQKNDLISERVIEEMKIGSLTVRKYLDKKIFGQFEGGYNGHVPVSAIFAFLGYFCAVVYDYKWIVVANEFSSNFGNITYKGEKINHQWSKSLEFEKLFQDYARSFLSSNIAYFSLLRPFYEIRIVEMFAKYKKYFSIFSSCNRNFRIHKERPKTMWCGECPKCVFAWTMLSAFLNKKEIVKIFNKNLYEDEKLLPLFADILGYGKIKPFDCVGTFDESCAALFMAKNKFADSIIIKEFVSKIKNPEQLIETVFKTNDAPAMPVQFKLLGMKDVLILGYGKEGEVTKKYLKKYFPKIKIDIADQKNDVNYLQKQNDFDLVIKTPGLPKELVTRPYTTATNLFFSQIKNLTIGVTGSKGKSTTASLIFSILQAAGKKVRLLGNIGSPMLEILLQPIDPEEIFVIELSSYQLDDIQYSPNIAVALNLFPEHMNYHGDVKKYYTAKSNIAKLQKQSDIFIFDKKDKELKRWLPVADAKKIPFNDIKLENIKSSLLGKHNVENIKAAVAVAEVLKISKKSIKEGIEKFQSLPHRLELVGEFQGIKFYDDAISTTPESTIAAINSLNNVETIFLGGLDRGYDFVKLAGVIDKSKIRNIVFFPDSGKKIEESLQKKSKKKYQTLHTKNMAEAVKFATANTKTGGICLLSTASPSYSLWKNFEEKGNQFKKAFIALK